MVDLIIGVTIIGDTTTIGDFTTITIIGVLTMVMEIHIGEEILTGTHIIIIGVGIVDFMVQDGIILDLITIEAILMEEETIRTL